MIRPRAIVKDKELVYSGSFIVGANETVVITPFDDDTDYKFRFTINYSTEKVTTNKIETEDDDILAVHHYRSETLVLPTASRPRDSFAHDETYDYFISYSVIPCRSPAITIYQVTYNILRKLK